jgi:hypothetical protein
MTVEEYYGYYMALKLHFTNDKFNFFNCNIKHYSKNMPKDAGLLFSKIKKYYKTTNDFIGVSVSNILNDIPHIPYVSSYDDEVYMLWKKRIQSLPYRFETDLNFLFRNDFNQLFEVEGGQCKIVKYAMQNRINIETFIILNELLNFIPKIDNDVDDYLWPIWKSRVMKYRPFLKINISQYKEISRKIQRTLK